MRIQGIEACTIRHGERDTAGFMVRCVKCGAVAKEFVGSRSSTSNDDDVTHRRVMRKFESLGWSFLRGVKCPSCIRDGRAAQMRFIHASNPSPKGDTAMPDTPKLTGALPSFNREMDRSDRRVIFNKLDEVYTDEKSGYKVGWTDQKVATDLGVPLAWVKLVREENFGPVSSNPEIDMVLAEAKKWKEDEGVLDRKSQALIEASTKLLAEINKLADDLKKHTDKGELVERKMFQIAKAVRP